MTQSVQTAKNCCSSINSKEEQLHVAIIGSGSAAFSCAIKAAEGGARVTIIEASKNIGGCCVNVGCVPSKILIRAAELAEQQRNNPFFGLKNHAPSIDRALLSKQQSNRVDELRQAKYQNILDSNLALNLIKGYASFVDSNTLTIKKTDGTEQLLYADKILIATGSKPAIPPITGLTETPYWTSTEALFSEKLPKHLVVIGSSVIALEIAQAYRRLGSDVTIIARHTLLYSEDPVIGEKLTVYFTDEGISILENVQATNISFMNEKFSISTNSKTENMNQIVCDKLLISTGRQANTHSLNLNLAGIDIGLNGKILVNDKMETSQNNIYAAGDCSDMPQYVYVAAAAGSRAGTNMTGGNISLDLTTMPAVIFTDPQVATVGLTEKMATTQSIEVISRTLDLENVPRALANFDCKGFIKMTAEKSNGKILGVQVLAHNGGEIIQTAAIAIHNHMTVEELANQLFPYLTMVEGLKLCAQTFNKDVSELSCCAG